MKRTFARWSLLLCNFGLPVRQRTVNRRAARRQCGGKGNTCRRDPNHFPIHEWTPVLERHKSYASHARHSYFLSNDSCDIYYRSIFQNTRRHIGSRSCSPLLGLAAGPAGFVVCIRVLRVLRLLGLIPRFQRRDRRAPLATAQAGSYLEGIRGALSCRTQFISP